MKKTIGIIIITILTIVSCISTGIAIYLSKNYIKIPSQYRCESNEQIIDNVTYKQIIILNINDGNRRNKKTKKNEVPSKDGSKEQANTK